MRTRPFLIVNAALIVAMGLFVEGVRRFDPFPATIELASSLPELWKWQGTKFAQGVRCERVFLGPFGGPTLRAPVSGPHLPTLPRKLKFLEFNMHNLFERDFSILGRKVEGKHVKSHEDRQGLARIIKKSDPDVMTWVEVENVKAAELFNERYLENKYQVFLIEGNDQRGIDVAVLVRRGLPFDVEYRSLKDVKLKDAEEGVVFSRDLPIAIFRSLESGPSNEQFILMSTHYKSQAGKGGSAPRRLLQAEATEQAVTFLRQEFGEEVPLILTGDFNNHLPIAPEFTPLWRAGFKDVFDLAGKAPAQGQRGTHFYFPMNGPPKFNQLDGFLISGTRPYQVLEASVLPHLDAQGRSLPAPQSYHERETRPSDHLAIEMVLEY